MQKYILVQWPDSQMLMNHPRFHECLFVDDMDGHDSAGSSAYMCPEDLHDEIFLGSNKADHYAGELSELRQKITEAISDSFSYATGVKIKQTLDKGEERVNLETEYIKRNENGDIAVKCLVEKYDDNDDSEEDFSLDTFSIDNLIEMLRQLMQEIAILKKKFPNTYR